MDFLTDFIVGTLCKSFYIFVKLKRFASIGALQVLGQTLKFLYRLFRSGNPKGDKNRIHFGSFSIY
ncbi:hypothetical protein DQM28_09955 [Leptospira mayottensis]|uniref:Uncharacterized protein n=1 Tax=Leptospira mayottensis TaxID=1137606 RepID=A0ABN5NS22_9LEPT|nr:hypothetical protein DQM28_09955 [Leptospira mayottensis]